MKRSCPGTTKLKKLTMKLGVRSYVAIGILESLWHLTAREAFRGNIGKKSNEDICIGIDWDGDPDQLIDALVECEWLDRHDVHRLVVHDWPEHADDAVVKAVRRKGTGWAVDDSVKVETLQGDSGNVEKCRDKSRLPEPEASSQSQKPEPASTLALVSLPELVFKTMAVIPVVQNCKADANAQIALIDTVIARYHDPPLSNLNWADAARFVTNKAMGKAAYLGARAQTAASILEQFIPDIKKQFSTSQEPKPVSVEDLHQKALA